MVKTTKDKTVGIVLAGGEGTRFGEGLAKQFIKIAGKTVIEHTLDIFERNDGIEEIFIVINPEYYDLINELLVKNTYKKIKKVLKGGRTRRESSYIGITACDETVDNVLIHDAVRPFLSNRIINDMLRALHKYSAVDVAIDSADTIIKVNGEGIIETIPNRKYLKRGQTPQGFKLEIIKKAHRMFLDDQHSEEATDDCSLVLKYKLADIFVVEGEQKNIKITYPEDTFLADKLFQLNSSSLVLDKSFSFNEINNKVLIVFGFSSGIGKEVFDLAKQYRAKVYGFSTSNGVDITDYAAICKALNDVYAKEGKIDFVVNTAGVLKITTLESLTQAEILNQVNVNLVGSINVVKASIEYLKKSAGMIVLFGSSSYTRGRAMYSLYSSCKSALVNFVQAIADELAPHSVRINIMSPERTKTRMRVSNFGFEPEDSLLDPKKAAEVTIQTLFAKLTGTVISIKK